MIWQRNRSSGAASAEPFSPYLWGWWMHQHTLVGWLCSCWKASSLCVSHLCYLLWILTFSVFQPSSLERLALSTECFCVVFSVICNNMGNLGQIVIKPRQILSPNVGPEGIKRKEWKRNNSSWVTYFCVLNIEISLGGAMWSSLPWFGWHMVVAMFFLFAAPYLNMYPKTKATVAVTNLHNGSIRWGINGFLTFSWRQTHGYMAITHLSVCFWGCVIMAPIVRK